MKTPLKFAVAWLATLILVSCSNTETVKKGTGTYVNSTYVSTVTKDLQSAVFGASNSKVQIKIFSDYQCPACQKFHTIIEDRLWKDYITPGKVTATFYNFPLTFAHENAEWDALGALCALSEGKFKEFRNEMYALEIATPSRTKVTDSQRVELAKKIGLSEGEFSTCLSEGWYQKTLEKEIKEGERLGLQATPSIYVNDKLLKYETADQFFLLLDAFLK